MIEAGSGASEHNLIDPDLINPKTLSFVSDLKDWNFVSQQKHYTVSEIVVNSVAHHVAAISLPRRSIFCMEKSANAQARSVSL